MQFVIAKAVGEHRHFELLKVTRAITIGTRVDHAIARRVRPGLLSFGGLYL